MRSHVAAAAVLLRSSSGVRRAASRIAGCVASRRRLLASAPSVAAASGGMATSPPPPPSVAVVGGGVAGVVCASSLADRHFAVTLFDAGRGPGGRASHRRAEQAGAILQFDHGASFFRLSDERFRPLLSAWLAAGTAAVWQGRFGLVQDGQLVMEVPQVGLERYVGYPYMNAMCVSMAQASAAQLRSSTRVASIAKSAPSSELPDPTSDIRPTHQWNLMGESGASLGVFDFVVAADRSIATPRSNPITGALPILGEGLVPSVQERMTTVRARPCFALMLAFDTPLTEVPFDCAEIRGSDVVALAARDSSKPGRPFSAAPSPECWVLHSTYDYAEKLLHAAEAGPPLPEGLHLVAQDMLTAFRAIIRELLPGGSNEIPEPSYIRAHRWGSSWPEPVLGEDCLISEAERFAACGDFCLSPFLEGAAISGMAAANRVAECLQQQPKL